MKTPVLVVLVALVLGTAGGQAQPPPPPDITGSYGSDPQQTFDLYLSPVTAAPVPLVVLIHPGAWWTGDKACAAGNGCGARDQAVRLNGRSFTTASINYRYTVTPGDPDPPFPTPAPAQRQDVAAAVEHFVNNASTYNIDPQRVFLWGMSGGAYLASAAVLQGGVGVRGVVQLFGPTTFGYRADGSDRPRLAWDLDITRQCPPQEFCSCNPAYEPPDEECNRTHAGWFCTSADPKSMVSALAGCQAATEACSEGENSPVEKISLDRTDQWVTNAPPPFTLVHHVGDCAAVPLRQVSRLYDALGSSRADLWEVDASVVHGYDGPVDNPIVDAFLDEYVNWRAAGTGDFNGDGKTDLLWQDPSSGVLRIWLMNGTVMNATVTPAPDRWGSPAVLTQKVIAVADLNSDVKPDLLWRDRKSGALKVWLMNGPNRAAEVTPYPNTLADLNWSPGGAADFNNDGKPDLLWRNRVSGKTVVWYMNGTERTSAAYTTPDLIKDPSWSIAGVGRFDAADSQPDILWRNTTSGTTVVSKMSGSTFVSELSTSPGGLSDLNWRFAAVGNFDTDPDPDWLWQNWISDRLAVWFFTDLVQTGTTATTPDMAPKAP